MAKSRRKQKTGEVSGEKTTVTYHDVKITGTATVDGPNVTVYDAEVSVGDVPPALPVPADNGETYRVRQTGMVTGVAGGHRIVRWDANAIDGLESIYVGDNASPEFSNLHHGQRFTATVERSTRSTMPIRVLEVMPLPLVEVKQQPPTFPLLPPHLERSKLPHSHQFVSRPDLYDYEDQIVLRKDFPSASAARVDAGWELFSLTPERRNNGLEYITIWRRIKV